MQVEGHHYTFRRLEAELVVNWHLEERSLLLLAERRRAESLWLLWHEYEIVLIQIRACLAVERAFILSTVELEITVTRYCREAYIPRVDWVSLLGW